MSAMIAPARIETAQGRRWWKCPACGRTLGELTGDRLVIRAGDRTIKLPIVPGTEQECPRCHGESALLAVAC